MIGEWEREGKRGEGERGDMERKRKEKGKKREKNGVDYDITRGEGMDR